MMDFEHDTHSFAQYTELDDHFGWCNKCREQDAAREILIFFSVAFPVVLVFVVIAKEFIK